MPLGIQQNNNFAQIIVDIWNDKVFYQEQEFPAGFMAASILNISEDDLKELIQAGGAPTFLFPVVIQGSDVEAARVLPVLRERMIYLTKEIWKYPPFCYSNPEKELRRIDILFDDNALSKIRTPNSEFQQEFLIFRAAITRIPMAILHFILGTGLRVSELYGLTRADIDFDRRCIHVRRQLCRTAEKPYFVTPPKTKSGIRNVPMTDTVYIALMRVVKGRTSPKVELLVDGHSGFLFLDKSGMPKVAMHLENYMRGLQARFEQVYGKPVPRITPHVLRHTFCTNVQQAELDVKSLQYLIGHSNASVTLDVYTHSSFDSVERAFEQIASSL